MDKLQLAAFLRQHRERLNPSIVGLPAAGPRRTPGLRREEVAALASISTQYYTRLEQARGPRPSRQVLAGLGRALRLDDAQRRHLYALAGEPFASPPGPSDEVPDNILDLVERLPETAAIVLNAKYDVLAWNPLAAALIDDFSALPKRERNIIRRYFLGSPSNGYIDDGTFAKHAVGQLRAVVARYPGDRPTQDLVRELLQRSPDFARRWPAGEVVDERRLTKTFNHPEVGRLTLNCDVLVVPERDQHVVLYTAEPGSPSQSAFRLLSVIGTQRMAPA